MEEDGRGRKRKGKGRGCGGERSSQYFTNTTPCSLHSAAVFFLLLGWMVRMYIGGEVWV